MLLCKEKKKSNRMYHTKAGIENMPLVWDWKWKLLCYFCVCWSKYTKKKFHRKQYRQNMMRINWIHNWLSAWMILYASIDAVTRCQAWKIETACFFCFFFTMCCSFTFVLYCAGYLDCSRWVWDLNGQVKTLWFSKIQFRLPQNGLYSWILYSCGVPLLSGEIWAQYLS